MESALVTFPNAKLLPMLIYPPPVALETEKLHVYHAIYVQDNSKKLL
jgi:hypothetical protein